MKCFAILLAEFFRHAYFRAMLILKCHSFGNCLFSSHAYFQERAYYRENTVLWIHFCKQICNTLFPQNKISLKKLF